MADQRERTAQLEDVIREAVYAALLGVQTAMVVQIVDYDPATQTCTVQPALKTAVQQPDGSWQHLQQSPLVKCPVVFPSGGGWTLTFPLQPGDEALAIFSHREIDNWWLRGGIQQRVDMRHHHASDGFVLAGVRSLPRALSNANASVPELRSDDGATSLSIEPGRVIVKGNLLIEGELQTNQAPQASVAPISMSLPLSIGGTVYYMKLSATP